MMAEALAWHEVPEMATNSYQACRWSRRTTPSRSRPAPASLISCRLAVAGQYIPEAKRKGLPHRVLKLVSTHKLADEAREKMPDGVTVGLAGTQGNQAQHHGADVPQSAAVEAAEEIGAVVEETACRKARRGRETIYCPFYDTCHYQRRRLPAREADVVFAAHEIAVPGAAGARRLRPGHHRRGVLAKGPHRHRAEYKVTLDHLQPGGRTGGRPGPRQVTAVPT